LISLNFTQNKMTNVDKLPSNKAHIQEENAREGTDNRQRYLERHVCCGLTISQFGIICWGKESYRRKEAGRLD
jgi:hypothetical protein